MSRLLLPSRLLTLAVVLLATGGAACGGDEAPEDSEPVETPTEAGDCLRPDPDRPDGFRQAECDADDATVEVTSVVAAADDTASPGPACPPGTDVVAAARQGEAAAGRIEGQDLLWCLRNLEGPHPGDPGSGGGEVVPGDCFRREEGGAVQEVRCGEAPFKVLLWASRSEECPPETTDPVELVTTPPEIMCSQATGAAPGEAATTTTAVSVPPPTDPPAA